MITIRTIGLSIIAKKNRILHRWYATATTTSSSVIGNGDHTITTTTSTTRTSTSIYQNQQPHVNDIITSYTNNTSVTISENHINVISNSNNSSNTSSSSELNTSGGNNNSVNNSNNNNNNNDNSSGIKIFFSKLYGQFKKFAQELNQQTKHGVLEYYTNWKFYRDIIRPKQMMGTPLSRQEIISMKSFKKDTLYFIPLFIYLSIPFSTFGLPLYIKYLSAILPSTFSTREMIVKRYLKKMRKRTDYAKTLYNRLKSRDDLQPNQKITLSNLNRGDLVLLYKCIGFNFAYTSTDTIIENIIQWEKEIIYDNKVILREGIRNLSIEDLQDIAYARGIPFSGKNYDQLLQQLSTSLILSPAAPSHSSCALSVMNSLLSEEKDEL